MDQEFLDGVEGSHIVVVDAPAGFGKSRLLGHLAGRAGSARWVSDLRELGDVADPGTLLLLDDAGRFDDSLVVSALEGASRRVGSRVIVAGRGLGEHTRRFGLIDGNDLIGGDDLAHSAALVSRHLVGRGLDLEVADTAALTIQRASRGWPPLVTHLVNAVVKHGLPGLDAASRHPATAEAFLLPLLEQLDPELRRELGQVLKLPALDDGLVDELGARPLVDHVVQLGLPLWRTSGGALDLAPVLRQYLAERADLDADLLRRLGPALVERGHAIEVARLLLQTGGPEAVGEFLTGLPLAVVDGIDGDDLASLVELLSVEADRWPRLLLLGARAEAGRARLDAQRNFLTRAAEASSGHDVEAVRGEARAELILLDALSGRYSTELRARIEDELAACCAGDGRRETRLVEALGVLLAGDDRWESLETASIQLDRAARRWDHLGERNLAGSTLRMLTMQALIPLGRIAEAEEAITRADEVCAGGEVERARNLAVRTRVAALAARADARHSIEMAEELARRGGYRWILAYASWSRMLVEAVDRRPDETLALHERTWHELGELQAHSTGLIFLCESAAALARAGSLEEALRVLDKAAARRQENELEFSLAALVVAGRRAPESEVRSMADELMESGKIPAARRWSVLLNVAVAARRGRTAELPSILERVALEAELCGLSELPRRLEPELFAVSSDLDDARGASTIRVRVLGAFDIAVDGVPVLLPSSRAASLVKLLAVRDGSAPVDLVIEHLWPEVDPRVGRRRLKNVLSRTKAALGPAIVRGGDRLAFSSSVVVDRATFDVAARQAALLARTDPVAAVDAAHRALSVYAGELLPDDAYDDRIGAERTELRSRALSLVDLLSSAAVRDESPEQAAALADLRLRIARADD